MDSWTLAQHLPSLPGGSHTLLFGPPGTGKTWLAAQVADALGVERHAITCHQRITPEELIARPWVTDGSCTYERGPALIAWTTGTMLQLDEANDCGEEALQALRVILGGPNERLTLPDGTQLSPALDSDGRVKMRCIATSNAGPEDLPQALQDRFAFRIPVLAPSEEALAALPKDIRHATELAYQALLWTPEDPTARPIITYREAAAYALALKSGLPEDHARALVWTDRADVIADHLATHTAPVRR